MSQGQFEDEFQFKPLTEGLGFHKKSMELPKDFNAEVIASMPTQTGILPKPKNNLGAPLTSPAKPVAPKPAVSKPTTTVAKPMAAVAWNATLANKDFAETKTPVRLQEIASNWPASFFDMAMVAGITLLFSAVVFALIQVDLTVLIESLQTDFGLQSSTVAVVIAVLEIYTVATRTFFGKTLGEWVFDSRLGTPAEQATFSYPFKVAWRTFVIAFTGFFILPTLSSLIGEDLAGMLSGVKLYAEK